MNRAKLKNYAPQARRDFIQTVTDRAAYYGLTPKKTEAIIEKGDVALIGGRAFPRSVAQKRRILEERINRCGFEQVMEAMAYTWFNRFVAIRFMELHGYLDHGYRVLSHPEGKMIPEILEHAEHVDLPGLDRNKVIELKLEGAKEDELYRLILIAQCNALHSAMPFLFEWINDETELLLPDNLLHSDSLNRKLLNEIQEEDWQEVEIIGWLYQFYISEKKDQVIGKVIKSEDIPAATQLFTPNWIVKYMVQNSLGRLWLATYPNSTLLEKMAYYIEPAEQTIEVQAQLKAITPEGLNPEEITLLDPALGSGHILVEAYDLFKSIYHERGYRAKDIPTLILQKNLFGSEICDRSAQLAAFALMMKARADDRHIFDSKIQPNVLAIQESKGLDPNQIANALLLQNIPPSLVGEGDGREGASVTRHDLIDLLELFKYGKTFGSLITVPDELAEKLPALSAIVNAKLQSGDMFAEKAAAAILPFVEQAEILARQYDCVVANPPYMGGRWMNKEIKKFAKDHFPDSKADLFAMFTEHLSTLAHKNGYLGFVTPFVWMFISSYEKLRKHFFTQKTITSLVKPSYTSFFDSAIVPLVTFVIRQGVQSFKGDYFDLGYLGSAESQPLLLKEAIGNKDSKLRYLVSANDFKKLPGWPIAYWASDRMREAFAKGTPLQEIAEPRQGMATADNERFLRRWYEVNLADIGFLLPDRKAALSSGEKWFPYNKGGEFRKWYGNNDYLVNWENDGQEIKAFRPNAVIRNPDFYFKPALTWSFVSSSFFGVRRSDQGFIFDVGGSSAFPPEDIRNLVAGFLCSRVVFEFMKLLNPTMNFQVGNVGTLPLRLMDLQGIKQKIDEIVEDTVQIAHFDWDSFETSWEFLSLPWLASPLKADNVADSWHNWQTHCNIQIKRMQELETESNRLFIQAYGLQDELSAEVLEDQITLARADKEADMKHFISYAIGCIMGRYSLDKPGLIYAHSKNTGFDPNQHMTFPADQDGIIPVMEGEWFSHDATDRFVEFVTAVWPGEHLEENLRFIAESLGPNRSEQPRDTIRRYLAQSFFRDHLKTYKKRPIYWLFSSGKLRAFQCLVYLHRYNESTLSRMRTEYVIPLQGKIASRIEQLADEIQNATSTSHRKKMEKERDTLIKQQAELQSFDEKLRHYADLRISLDLDDGVKVNYGKFGDLLAEVKTVTGGSEE